MMGSVRLTLSIILNFYYAEKEYKGKQGADQEAARNSGLDEYKILYGYYQR